jgi:hypothetical protein
MRHRQWQGAPANGSSRSDGMAADVAALGAPFELAFFFISPALRFVISQKIDYLPWLRLASIPGETI